MYNYNGTTLHYTTLITLHYATLQLHYTRQHYNYSYNCNYATLHYTALHYLTLHYITFHSIAKRYVTLHYATLIAPPQMQLQLRYSYTTPQLQLHYTTTTTTTTAALHHTTSSSCGWGTTATVATTPETQLRPPFSPSVDSLCHPWFTTTKLSYRFPILKLPPSPCAFWCFFLQFRCVVTSHSAWSHES